MNPTGLTNFSKRFHLDIRSDAPIYLQIVDQIKQQIANGALEPGDQLPTVRGLATDLRINFNTVARAYRILDEERIISTQQGRGTYITEKPPPKVTERMRRESLEALARRFIEESTRLGFVEAEIHQIVSDQLKSWKETQDSNAR
jgi:GntR family transcriptional regulator